MGLAPAWKRATLLVIGMGAWAAVPGAPPRPAWRTHGIMRPDPAAFRRWELERRGAPQKAHAQVQGRAAGADLRPALATAPPASFSLLPLVPDSTDRNQGDCGSCWVWASTALAEVALNSQFGIQDRLSVQYFQSNNLAQAACYGGSLTEFCDWYNNNDQAPPNPNPGILVPWSNPQGAYADGAFTNYQLASTVPPGGVGLTPDYAGLVLNHQTLDLGDPSVTQAQAIADIQAALLGNQVVGFSFFTNFSAADGFDAFWANQPGTAIWINNYEGASTTFPYSGWGGHMVTLVGWNATDPNPANQYWIVLNQWGTTPTRLDECFRIPMYLNYGATYTMVDPFGTPWVNACYGFETLTLATQPGATFPPAPPAAPTGTLPSPAGPAQAGSVLTLAPAITAGTPPFTYQWQVDLGHGQGLQALAGATGSTLALPNGATPGYGVLDASWDGVRVALAIGNATGTTLLGPVTLQVAGAALNADGGFEAGSATSQWLWNDLAGVNPIIQGYPTHSGSFAAALAGENFPSGNGGTLTSAPVTLPADPAVPVFASYYLFKSTLGWQPLVLATCTLQVVDASGNVLQVLKTHTNLDVDHLAYLPECFEITALNKGGTQVALQAVWSDPEAVSLFLLDDAQILSGTAGSGNPTLAGFAPAGGAPGIPVVLTGNHFTGAGLVTFGRDYASTFTVDSDTQITALVPWDAATGPITVTTPGGTASSGATFYVAPSIISDPASFAYVFNYGILPEMSPSLAAVAGTVQIYGFNFNGTTGVAFGGVPAAQFTVTSNTVVSAVVPAGARNGPITVTAPGGSATTQGSFGVAIPVLPTLASAAPAAANPGTTVTLGGTGLTTVTQVTFNGVPATSFSMVNDTTLTAAVPFGAGSGPVVVTDPVGSAGLPFVVLPPAITCVIPVTNGQPGTSVNISGNGFLDVTGVAIDAAAAAFSIRSNTLITAVIPSGLRPLQTVGVTVTSVEGTSAPAALNVYVPAPTVAIMTPASGPVGSLVTLTGQYFTDTCNVSIGGVNCPSYTVVDDAHLQIVVPADAVNGPIWIGTPWGGWTSPVPFTIQLPAPACSGFAPAAGFVGTLVTLTGTHFTGATLVGFGGVAATAFTVVNDGQITAVVPAGAVTGPVQVTTTWGSGTSAAPFTVQAQVSILQAPDNLLEGAGFSFSAKVTGAAAGTVTWSVAEGPAGGAIDAAGNYTAPATPGQYHVVATSTAVPTASATALVPVNSACLNPAAAPGAPVCVVDLAYLMAAMGSRAGAGNYNALADLNGDGVIDDADLTLFLAAF